MEQRDARIARALQIRIDEIVAEMRSCEDLRQLAIEVVDACLAEFDELAGQRFRLKRALWKVEQRLSQAAFNRNRRDREVAA